ncbi:MAG: tyrosine-type recombinase/integrase [Candidatus Woesearchaeota archaeon]
MIEYLEIDEIQQLKALTKEQRDALLIATQYETGCTVSELINIRREDLRERHIHVEDRLCRVSTTLLEQLSLYVKTHESPYVFPSRQQDRLTQKRVQQIIRKRLRALNKDLDKTSPHLLRYSHIVHAVQQNIPLQAIMQQTGLKEMRLSQIISQIQTSTGYEEMFT